MLTVAGAPGPAILHVTHILVVEPSVVILVNKAKLVSVFIDAMEARGAFTLQAPLGNNWVTEHEVVLQSLSSVLLSQNKSNALVAFDKRPVLLQAFVIVLGLSSLSSKASLQVNAV